MAYAQVPGPQPRYIRGGGGKRKGGGFTQGERGHWALPNGSWVAPPVNAGNRGFSQVAQSPPSLIDQLAQLHGGNHSNIAALMAMAHHLSALPQSMMGGGGPQMRVPQPSGMPMRSPAALSAGGGGQRRMFQPPVGGTVPMTDALLPQLLAALAAAHQSSVGGYGGMRE